MVGLRDETGAAIVEFAIILPILLLLVMGIIQFGFIFNGQITLTSAVREGARYAVVGNTDADVVKRVKDSAVALLLSTPTVTIDRYDGKDNPKESLTVEAKGTVDVIMPFLDIFTGKKVELTGKSTMRVEKPLPYDDNVTIPVNDDEDDDKKVPPGQAKK
jgi:Flp pilus assembly pilin Flp